VISGGGSFAVSDLLLPAGMPFFKSGNHESPRAESGSPGVRFSDESGLPNPHLCSSSFVGLQRQLLAGSSLSRIPATGRSSGRYWGMRTLEPLRSRVALIHILCSIALPDSLLYYSF
jgi:hypothetical protein